MLKHVVMWKFKEDSELEKAYASDKNKSNFINKSEDIKANIKKALKTRLEALVGVIPELISLKVIELPLQTSTHDVALICEVKSEKDLEGYAKDKRHTEIIESCIKPYLTERCCLDYIE